MLGIIDLTCCQVRSEASPCCSPKRVLRDTYVMTPGERADLVFIADNPGLWLFHCHTLEHHAAGMGGVISVT